MNLYAAMAWDVVNHRDPSGRLRVRASTFDAETLQVILGVLRSITGQMEERRKEVIDGKLEEVFRFDRAPPGVGEASREPIERLLPNAEDLWREGLIFLDPRGTAASRIRTPDGSILVRIGKGAFQEFTDPELRKAILHEYLHGAIQTQGLNALLDSWS